MTQLMVKKPIRSASGVNVVAVMSKPMRCPHGRCIYCPGGVEYNTPQSYIGNEPALMRAIECDFDPYRQVYVRLSQYVSMGHKPSKVWLIVMGGTFPAAPEDYQKWFMAMCYEALNRFPNQSPPSGISIEEAISRNEEADVRCVGVTFETRPDWAKETQADLMLRLGGTKVEIGVQTIYEEVLSKLERGHSLRDVIEATRILKDCGFKVGYHVMPGLPGSSVEKDLEMFKVIFEDQRFKPDYLKIYPTLVIRGTKLYEMWVKGEYSPLSDEQAVEIASKACKYIPRWVRVSRIQRDVPVDMIDAGVKKSNLREIVEERAKEGGFKCKCIRCREVGLLSIKNKKKLTEVRGVEVRSERYKASEGVEEFISAEDFDNDVLVGFIRLRIPSDKAHRPEVKQSALIRELHVYGVQVPVGERWEHAWQHRGWGAKLLKEAERIAKEDHGLSRVVVLPGVGVREYFRRNGYELIRKSAYMAKSI